MQFVDRIVRSALVAAVVATGCGPQRHAVIAATGTSIGVDISQNPATQSPQAKLGYQRVELAIVPTNRSAEADPGTQGHGAADHGEVIMELRYNGIFETGPSSGIYQRLAVGKEAVTQPGAAMLFAKDDTGTVSEGAAKALQSLMSVPGVDVDRSSLVAGLARLRRCHRAEIDKALSDAGVASLGDLDEGKATASQLEAIKKATAGLAPCA